MHSTDDILADIEQNENTLLFKIVLATYLILIIAANIFLFLQFRKSLSDPFRDGEFVMLLVIHLIYPTSAFGLLCFRKIQGWFCLQFYSLVNAAYSISFYMDEGYLDVTDLFSFIHIVLAVVMTHHLMLYQFSIEKKTAIVFSMSCFIVSLLFFTFAF